MHAPETQAAFVQVAVVVHWPVGSHVSTALPMHWVAPGTQTPVHAPCEHAYGHADAALQVPPAPQVSTPLPEHCVEPGIHTPVHAPETHAWVVQGVVAPHVPSAPHTCTALPEHCVPASEQGPEQ